LLLLGDRFQVRTVLKACERHLLLFSAIEVDLANRLAIAERFTLIAVRVSRSLEKANKLYFAVHFSERHFILFLLN
jgi:hypothetical protein